ncbi:MAG TPA: tetratricopeptide repeat protein [Phycisphaerae bacterium]|nr:tetratricopeptide repeat protein [Phycisphaerae bacterium]
MTFCICSTAPLLWGQSANPDDAIARSMRFVEESMAATDLLNAGKPAEALVLLQQLSREQPELDEDGYVAITLGDCLALLGRGPEARETYAAAAVVHPQRKVEIEQKTIAIDLAGPISDELIARLRKSAAVSGEEPSVAAWQLARALQKRARDLLNEAIDSFTRAYESGLAVPFRPCRGEQWPVLIDLSRQLSLFIGRFEERWARYPQQPLLHDETKPGATADEGEPLMTEAAWTIQQPDGRRVVFELLQPEAKAPPQITADGRPVNLTPDQTALVRAYQQRISEILTEMTPAPSGILKKETTP